MRLVWIELDRYKRFADRSRMNVDGKLVAIVGPNEAGKTSCASLLLAEQRNPAEIAEALGHSLATLFGTYAHVIDELRGQPPQSAESRIKRARAKVRGLEVVQK